MRRKSSTTVLLIGILWSAASLVQAQQPPETLPFLLSGQAFDSRGIDSVNLFNGDLGITLPLGAGYVLGPTGYPYQPMLHSSAKFWHFSVAQCTGVTGQFAWIAGDPTVGVGWTFQPGYVVKRLPPGAAASWEYYGPDGGAHQFDLSASNPAVTKDGTFLRLSALPNNVNPTSYTVEFPDGTIQTFNHLYTAPQSSPSTVDFRNVDSGEGAQTRFGLATTKDRFGNTLYTVNWTDASHLSEFSSITLNPFSSTITATWISKTVNGITWRVLDNLVLPAPSSKQLKVQFAYASGTFTRNSFDTSGANSCTDSGTLVNVPELATATFSDPGSPASMLPFSYSFTYNGSPTGVIQKQGTIKVATLPSLGTLTYDYCTTASQPCNIGVNCDPNGASTHCNPNAIVEIPDPDSPNPGLDCPPQGCPPPLHIFTDSSPGVATRAEFDPFTNRTAITYYDRSQFRGDDGDGLPSDSLVFRRTTVTSPGGDEPAATTFVRRHYFKVDDSDPANPRDAAGIELDRRYYAGSDPTQPAIRTIINCWPGFNGLGRLCGYQDGLGGIVDYDFTQIGRRPPIESVVWFGATPSNQDGGTCSTSYTVKCTAVNNTNYNATAGRYNDTATTSTLPPGTLNRHVQTNWTPTAPTDTSHYILDLFDHRYTWDGASLPGGSDGQSVVRQRAFFDPTGFLLASWTWDSAISKVIKDCQYNANSNGTVTGEYTQTYSSSTEPTSNPCPASMPITLPADSDTFGRDNTWTNLLLTKSAWRNGVLSIGWNALDLVRDNAGFITESRAPNYPTNSALKTSYTYDSMGRIVKAQPPGGSGVEWPTTSCYLPGINGFTPFLIVKKTSAAPNLDPNSATGICNRDEGVPGANSGPMQGFNYDGFGRLVREIKRSNHKFTGATYFSKRDLRYDSAGNTRIVSDWQACPHDSSGLNSDQSISACALPKTVAALDFPGHNLWLFNFDPFGRPQIFGSVDGGNIATDTSIDRTDTRVSPNIPFSDSYRLQSTLCVNGTWSTSTCTGGGVQSYTATEMDGLGRVTKVTEPNPTTGALSTDTTSYTYNVFDTIYQITQGSQNRTFQYLAFGFLESAKTPENGSNGNGTTTYSYGSLGNLRTKNDGVIQYNYTTDPAGRVTWITTGSGFPTSYIVNCYDGLGICGDSSIPNFAGGTAPKGELTRRVGVNQIPYRAAAVYDDYTYSDPGGRQSAQTTSIGQRGTDLTKNGFGVPVTQSWTYNTLGLVAAHTLPRPGGSSTTLTVNDSVYTSGLLTNVTATRQGGVTQQVMAANYQESGRLADYTTGSTTPNVKTTIGTGNVIPSRIASLTSVSTSAGTLFSTGTYGYDGISNIKSIGSGLDSFAYDARSRLTSATYSGAGTQGFTYDRYGNLTSKTGVNPISLPTSTSTNHITTASYDDRGNFISLASGSFCGAADSICMDDLNRMTRSLVSFPAADFLYLYDGGGERVAKFASSAGSLRREFARLIIEGRGDTSLGCTNPGPFNDVTCAANPNDGKYVQKMKDIGITSGCGSGNYCPEVQTPRDQSSVFFLKGEHCALNTNGCTYAPPPCSTTHVFNDVACPSQYADWVGQLYQEGITVGCGANNFCPTQPLGTWQMLAWAQKIWPSYNPLPRDSVMTYRDPAGLVTTEANQSSSTGDASQSVLYTRDNIFLGRQLVSSAVWSGTTPNYQFYASDHLGTPRLITDINANLVQLRKFWPYGDDGPTSGSESFQRLKLAGMERDNESKNYFDHARVQNFSLGRFLSPDPIFGTAGNPQTWNRYSYALGNPLRLIDPSGLMTCVQDNDGNMTCHEDIGVGGSGETIPLIIWGLNPGGGGGGEGGGGEGGGGGGGRGPGDDPSKPPQKPFRACVQDASNYFSLQHAVQSVSGGELGNGVIADALLGGNTIFEDLTLAEGLGSRIIDAISPPSEEEFDDAVRNKLIDRGLGMATGFAGKHGADVGFMFAGGVAVAGTTARGTSFAVAVGGGVAGVLPFKTAAEALHVGLEALGHFKLAYDASVAAFSAVVCGIGR